MSKGPDGWLSFFHTGQTFDYMLAQGCLLSRKDVEPLYILTFLSNFIVQQNDKTNLTSTIAMLGI